MTPNPVKLSRKRGTNGNLEIKQTFLTPAPKKFRNFYLLTAVNSAKSMHVSVQFARIHTSSLINIEKILNEPITKFCNGNGINVIAAELRLIKMSPTSFYKKHTLL